MARKVVLAGACRTAIGTMGGSLSGVPAPDLGTIVIKEALKRTGIQPDMVDEVYMGCVIQAGLDDTAHVHFVDHVGLDACSLQCLFNNDGAQIRSGNAAQASAHGTDGCSAGACQYYFSCHNDLPPIKRMVILLIY